MSFRLSEVNHKPLEGIHAVSAGTDTTTSTHPSEYPALEVQFIGMFERSVSD
jgi:hypothetical protein